MSAHIVPVKTYVRVAVVLFVLLIVTIAASMLLPAGAPSVVAGLVIAGIKASLVALFFMHLRYSSPAMRVFAASGLVWLAILLALTLNDYLSRG